MKKIFLTALTAMALCSYSYAQDDEDEYEEDEAPAASQSSSNSESSAPATQAAPAQAGAGTFALGLDLIDALDNEHVQKFYVTYRLAPNMEISGILGLYHHGETTQDVKAEENRPAREIDTGDDYTQIQIGVGFDYYLLQIVLPVSVGGELLFSHWGEDDNQITLNGLAGIHANLVGGLYLTGKVGLGIDYITRDSRRGNVTYMNDAGISITEVRTYDESRLDIGFKTSVVLSWFFM